MHIHECYFIYSLQTWTWPIGFYFLNFFELLILCGNILDIFHGMLYWCLLYIAYFGSTECEERKDIKRLKSDSFWQVKILLDIWRDYKEETETRVQSTPKLAEPPHVRERLIQEICFLADNVREKSVKKGLWVKQMVYF